MRTGTFLCWLFGHNFLGMSDIQETGTMRTWTLKPTTFCIRCGKTKEKDV